MEAPTVALADHFPSLEDPRIERTKPQPLLSNTVIALSAVVSRAES